VKLWLYAPSSSRGVVRVRSRGGPSIVNTRRRTSAARRAARASLAHAPGKSRPVLFAASPARSRMRAAGLRGAAPQRRVWSPARGSRATTARAARPPRHLAEEFLALSRSFRREHRCTTTTRRAASFEATSLRSSVSGALGDRPSSQTERRSPIRPEEQRRHSDRARWPGDRSWLRSGSLTRSATHSRRALARCCRRSARHRHVAQRF